MIFTYEELDQVAKENKDVWGYAFVKSKSSKKNRRCHTRPVRGRIINVAGYPYFIPYGSKGELVKSKRKDVVTCELNITDNEYEAKKEYNKLVQTQIDVLKCQMNELEGFMFDISKQDPEDK